MTLFFCLLHTFSPPSVNHRSIRFGNPFFHILMYLCPGNMDDLIEKLITRLESAHAGGPILTREILMTLGWRWECIGCPGGGLWRDARQSFHSGPLPPVSERVESARELISNDIFITAHEEAQAFWVVRCYAHPLNHVSDYQDPCLTARARTLPLALCSAAVRLSSDQSLQDKLGES